MVTHRFPLDRIGEAMDTLRAGRHPIMATP
jgi:hypothetical protein